MKAFNNDAKLKVDLLLKLAKYEQAIYSAASNVAYAAGDYAAAANYSADATAAADYAAYVAYVAALQGHHKIKKTA